MEGKKGPLFEVAQAIQRKRGTEDVFVLTARAPEAQSKKPDKFQLNEYLYRSR